MKLSARSIAWYPPNSKTDAIYLEKEANTSKCHFLTLTLRGALEYEAHTPHGVCGARDGEWVMGVANDRALADELSLPLDDPLLLHSRVREIIFDLRARDVRLREQRRAQHARALKSHVHVRSEN